jgi:predicted transcriptional regulator
MGRDDEVTTVLLEREQVLSALQDGPCDHRTLEERLDISKSTCHRIVRTLENNGLVRKSDGGYELTELGRVLKRQVDRYESAVDTAVEMEPLLRGIAQSDVDFEIELFADANIVHAQSNNPHPPINRFIELLRDSETLRNMGPTPVAPTMVDEVADLLFNEEKRLEIIKPEPVISHYVSSQGEPLRRAAEQKKVGFRICDDITFGLSLYDDHVGVRGYNLDTGSILLFADTDDPEAVAWGEAVFESYRSRAEPMSTFEELPEWSYELDIKI